MSLLKNTFLLALVRHLLGAAGAFLLAEDIATQAQWDTMLAGGMTLVAVLWSLVDKWWRTR